jgi:hypothetical protein
MCPLRETQKKVADGVAAGKAPQPQHGVQHPVRPEPFAVGKTLRAAHDGHHKRGQRVGRRDGVVGNGFGKGQVLLHLSGEPNLTQERDETGQTAKRRNGLGRFVQNQLGIAKE